MSNFSLVILAAGNSSRMGHPKQLKQFGSKTLVQHAIDAGLSSQCTSIVVVLGFENERIATLIEKSRGLIEESRGGLIEERRAGLTEESRARLTDISGTTQIKENHKVIDAIVNDAWAEGMGTSVAVGVRHIQKREPRPNGVLICTCDQPLMSHETLNTLIKTHQQSKKKIVASSYSGINGVPALFAGDELLAELGRLKGQEGARQLIKHYKDDVATVEFPEGAIDIDTEADWQALMEKLQVARL